MNNLNPSRKPAARTRSGNLLAWLLPAVLIPALLMLVLAGGATASAQVVTNSADSGPGTLRSAITNAASGAVITFDPSLSGATIGLASTLTINTNLTIDASALPGGFHISGNQYLRVFEVASNTGVTLNSLTITGGYTDVADGGGGIENSGTLTLTNCILSGNSAGLGGGIGNVGNLTLNQCTLSGNSSGIEGGGIYNSGTLALNQCTLSGNSSVNGGGGIYNGGGLLTLNQCTLSGNSAPGYGTSGNGDGGGIYNVHGALTLNQCTLSENYAVHEGGGIANFYATLTLNQCTLSGNGAGNEGGGISNLHGALTLNQCTLSENYAGVGGGIENGGTLTMTNTIVSGNSYADIYGSVTLNYGGSNLVQSVVNAGGTITGPAPLTNAPDLAPLGNYGGPTQTMPPLPGSPAIDAGSNDATNNFATDQRGLPRFVGPQVDIGAVEFQASPVVTNADSGPGSLRYAIAYVTNNATITFAPSLSGATITVSNTLTINTNLTIDASALPGGLQINGNHAVQIFNVASNTAVFLNSLAINNGSNRSSGGGIFNAGTLTLTNCTLSGNSSHTSGGIENAGLLTLNQCTLSGNSSFYNGGGIDNEQGTLTLNQCTLSGNSADPYIGGGGGIYNLGTATLTNCTLSGNSAGEGGGIYGLGDSLTLNQCTLSGNSAGHGGGIYIWSDTATLNQCTLFGNRATGAANGGGIYNNAGLLTLNQCTLFGNSAYVGGGVCNAYPNQTVSLMTNTIVGGNSATYGADVYNANNCTLIYGGSNLVQSVVNAGTISGPAPLTNAPDLAPLGNYGGPTQTMPPLPGSPAIGAGSVAANTFSTDQRGYPRTQNGLIDIGAVELQPPAANPPVLGNITVPAGGGNGLQFTFTNAPAADFTVLTATNVSLALTNWTVLGEVQQVAPGQYQFTDPQAATNTGRYYRVRSP